MPSRRFVHHTGPLEVRHQARCIEPWPTSPQVTAGADQGSLTSEVDGNRTRRTGIARPNRFEGGGAHQVPGHLRPRAYK